MARLADKLGSGPLLPEGSAEFLTRRVSELTGAGLLALAVAYGLALFSYSPSDPSLNSAGATHVANWLGLSGAVSADLAVQGFGLAAWLPFVTLIAWGVQALRKVGVAQVWLKFSLMTVAILLGCIALAAVPAYVAWPLATGLGGVAGDVLGLRLVELLQGWGAHESYVNSTTAAIAVAIPALAAWIASWALTRLDWRTLGWALMTLNHMAGDLLLKALGRLPNRAAIAQSDGDEDDNTVKPTRVRARKPRPKPSKDLVAPKAARIKAGKKAEKERQPSLDLLPADGFELPPLELLDAPDASVGSAQMSPEALQQNATMLSGVLADFGVKGDIVKVRPGPVITLYELEPAPGTKTSRVIGLSDDIARSMSAVSVRVATVPGRSVIGIEMPNQSREMVGLRELLASHDFEKAKGALNLALGKDIGGLPVIVDLARMPHLLISGTTGSGKSVGVNALICSLLYQYGPEQCRFIMIDPKMLELSVYDGIPHLLSPVVTEPPKAVVALKWTVREMEERYRAMSQLGVRNVAGYNARIVEAQKKGEVLTRRVQTGFDEAGKPVFEDQPLGTEPLPFIVVVVDEMADLMMVAGKDVEAAIQRLAQMARAAGIHIIMATQRPSVDVITGTIKANFPTRISFQVTSKIDSRTILGEQGAEQLLGQGDMLYMAGGGRITRVHAPFVSDEEVEEVVKHLKAQGSPAYLEDITEEPEEAGFGPAAGGGSADDVLYDEAVALVAREGKASTSFIQRHLQIGYNRAARIIEQMESQGVVSKANRVGRREVLIGDVSKAS